MRRALHRFVTLLFTSLLLTAAVDAQGVTLYVNRLVMAGPGDVSLGDLLRASGDIPADAQESLARSVAVMANNVLYIPAALYLPQLETAFGTDSIIVGSRSIVVPRGVIPEGEAYLIERLADFLEGQGLLGDTKAELSFVQNQVKGALPQEGIPVFLVQKTTKGSVEVFFSLADTSGNSMTGRVSLAGGTIPAPSGDGVKPGIAVQVRFRKGPITIEMPGKVLGPAGVGEKVSVYVSDSQKSFSGRVIDGKAVEVVLP